MKKTLRLDLLTEIGQIFGMTQREDIRESKSKPFLGGAWLEVLYELAPKRIVTSNFRDMRNLMSVAFGLLKMSFWVPKKGQL